MFRIILLLQVLLLAGACSTDEAPLTPAPFELQIGEVSYGVEPRADGRMWVFITDAEHEYVSAPLLAEDPDILIDINDLLLLGLTGEQLEQLDDAQTDIYLSVLQSPQAAQAAYLWQDLLDQGVWDPVGRAISRISQVFMTILESLPLGASSGDDWTANGCTWAPDFNFKHCCDAHDECYCIGGNAADRKVCDDALKACIITAGHPKLANIYYKAVRKFGVNYFNYH